MLAAVWGNSVGDINAWSMRIGTNNIDAFSQRTLLHLAANGSNEPAVRKTAAAGPRCWGSLPNTPLSKRTLDHRPCSKQKILVQQADPDNISIKCNATLGMSI